MLLNPLLERLEDSVNKNNEILDALTQWVCCLFCSLQPQSNIQTVRCLFYCSVYIYWRISTIFGTMYRDIMQHKNYWFAHLPYIMLLNYFRKTYFLVFSVWNVHWRLFCPVRRLGFLVITGVSLAIFINCAFFEMLVYYYYYYYYYYCSLIEFGWRWKEPFFGTEMRMQTWRWQSLIWLQ